MIRKITTIIIHLIKYRPNYLTSETKQACKNHTNTSKLLCFRPTKLGGFVVKLMRKLNKKNRVIIYY